MYKGISVYKIEVIINSFYSIKWVIRALLLLKNENFCTKSYLKIPFSQRRTSVGL